MKNQKDYIFGIRPIIEAVKSGKEFEKILIKKGLKGELFSQLLSLLNKNNIPFQFVPSEKINSITKKNHQGVIAYLSLIEYKNLEEIVQKAYEEGKSPLIIILDKITDIRNFGAITRSAECAGVDAIVIPKKGAARINYDAFKTSAGALNIVNVCRVNSIKDTIKFLKNCGLQIIAAHEKAEKNYYEADLVPPTAIIMGSEEYGISRENLQETDKNIKIPIFGNIESLNVSVAASILIYEAIRQRNT